MSGNIPLPFTIKRGKMNTDVIVWDGRPEHERIATREEKMLIVMLERTYEALNGCILVDWYDEEVAARAQDVLQYIKTGDINQLRQYVRKAGEE